MDGRSHSVYLFGSLSPCLCLSKTKLSLRFTAVWCDYSAEGRGAAASFLLKTNIIMIRKMGCGTLSLATPPGLGQLFQLLNWKTGLPSFGSHSLLQ